MFKPVQYVNNVTVIYADNLNAIQAALVDHDSSIANMDKVLASLHKVATSGLYSDLVGKPAIPSTAADVGALPLAGGEMTGNIAIEKAGPTINLSETSTGRQIRLTISTAGNRGLIDPEDGAWMLQKSNAGAVRLYGSADTLTTARAFQTNLGSTSTASFNGSAACNPGVTGVLGLANGGLGTNASTTAGLATAQASLGMVWKAGDTLTTTYNASGFITNGGADVRLGLSLGKPIKSGVTPTLTKFTATVRGINGYVGDSSGNDWLSIASLAVYRDIGLIQINVANGSAIANAANNTPVSAVGSISIRFA